MRIEILRHRRYAAADVLQHVDRHAGIAAARIIVGKADGGPAAVEPVGLIGLVAFGRRQLLIEMAAEGRLHAVDFFPGEDAELDQLLGIDLDRRRMRPDLAVHDRLCERRLVQFIVAEAAVAEHVDDDRLLEALAEFDRDFGDMHDGFRIISVHVKYRSFHHLGNVGAVGRGARVARACREADLVVDDEVHRAAGTVALEARQAEAFGDNALSRESGITVDQQRQHGRALARRASVLILLGANLTEHDRVHDLQVRGIGGQRQVHAVAVELAV